MQKMQNAFKTALANKRLLDVYSGTKVVVNVCAAKDLFEKWNDAAKIFTYKGQYASVVMTTEEIKFGRIRCTAHITWSNSTSSKEVHVEAISSQTGAVKLQHTTAKNIITIEPDATQKGDKVQISFTN